MTILVTGAAGFIGFHAARQLLERGERVTGVDCLTEYYDTRLKQARLHALSRYPDFTFKPMDIADGDAIRALVLAERPERILHLAAQAGVRYSIDAPFAYTHSNVTGHLAVLEAARALGSDLKHLIYASSSSVYGERSGQFREVDPVDKPVSLYAATKRAGELISETYAHLYQLPLTGLRFFTVYGPWGRPDMAYWSFAEAMLKGAPIKLFNNGQNQRDFTYIDDVIETITRMLDHAPGPRNAIYNIGGAHPVETMGLVRALERAFGVEAVIERVPPAPGDVSYTCADVSRLQADYGYTPTTRLDDGIARFAAWFREYRA